MKLLVERQKRPVKNWVVGCWHGYLSGARCRLAHDMAQLMPLPLTVACFSKIPIGFTFLVPAHPGNPGKGTLNGCVCVCVPTACTQVCILRVIGEFATSAMRHAIARTPFFRRSLFQSCAVLPSGQYAGFDKQKEMRKHSVILGQLGPASVRGR